MKSFQHGNHINLFHYPDGTPYKSSSPLITTSFTGDRYRLIVDNARIKKENQAFRDSTMASHNSNDVDQSLFDPTILVSVSSFPCDLKHNSCLRIDHITGYIVVIVIGLVCL